MHIFLYLIPRNHKTCSVGTEYRSCRIIQIPLGVIANLLGNLLLILAWFIAFQRTGEMAFSSCVGNHLALVIPHFCNRCTACDHSQFSLCLRSLEVSLHPLDIGHGTAYIFGRKFQPETVVWLQKDGFRLFQALTHCTVSCLTEISALCMLHMGTPCQQSHLHICDR